MTPVSRSKTRRCLARALVGVAALVAAMPALAEDYVIDNVTLVDGTGQPNQPKMSIGVERGRITFVTATAVAPKVSGRHIDATGRYLMPGLLDVHIHLRGARGSGGVNREEGLQALSSYLYAGVTTVYDAGNNAPYILGLRADEIAGKIQSPRILATGNIVTYPGSHGSQMAIPVDSWPQAKPALDKYFAEQKPDVMKLTLDEHGWGSRPKITLLPIDLMQEVILYANQHGIRTTAHTSSELRATEAIFAGVDSLAHPVIQGPISEEFAKLMAAKQTPMATTMTIGEGYSRLVEHPEYLDQPLYQASYSKAQLDELRGKTASEWKARSWTWWMKLMTPICQENMRQIHAAGGVIAVATDQSIGPAVHREMELLQSAGVPAKEIVTIATLNGAKHLGRTKDLGTVEPGKIADLLLLTADPTVDVNNMKRIEFVMKAGQLVDEDKLMLAGGQRPLRRAQR
jgi:imidazolonepropionase-like amidohydrolase